MEKRLFEDENGSAAENHSNTVMHLITYVQTHFSVQVERGGAVDSCAEEQRERRAGAAEICDVEQSKSSSVHILFSGD